MLTFKSLPTALIGAIFGISLVLACGDDGGDPIDAADAADAAACDCPASEPPIAGRIVMRTNAGEVPGGDADGPVVGCNSGEELLGGGCESLTAPDDMTLVMSSRDSAGNWQCRWRNGGLNPQPVTAQAFCLAP